jgi:hypothetical protein
MSMPIYQYQFHNAIVARLTFLLEKDDYYGGEHL